MSPAYLDLAENRAQRGILMKMIIGRSGQENVLASSDDELIALAHAEIANRLGVRGRPSLQRITRWPRGMPQYVLGHQERIERIDAFLRSQPALFLAGNAYGGVGLPDCIASGERAAEAAIGAQRFTCAPRSTLKGALPA